MCKCLKKLHSKSYIITWVVGDIIVTAVKTGRQ